MHPWHAVPIDDAALQTSVPVVLDNLRGDRLRYRLDLTSGLRRLIGPIAVSCPAHCGVVARTADPAGLPVTALVVTDEPLPVGVIVDIRPIGVTGLRQGTEAAHALIGVPVADPQQAEVVDVAQLGLARREAIERFVLADLAAGEAPAEPIGLRGPAEALSLLRAGVLRYRQMHS